MASRALLFTKTLRQKVHYSDVTVNLDRNPITGELEILENEASVINSVKNLVLTFPTERFYHPEIGTNISRSLF